MEIGIEERDKGGTTTTKGLLRIQIETFYCRSFYSQYMYYVIWKKSEWSYKIMGNTMSQLPITHH